MSEEIEELRERLNEHEERISSLESLIEDEGPEAVREKPLSLPEFKQDYSPSIHREKAVMIGYFLEKHRGKENFLVSDTKDGFKKCKYKLPANLSDVLSDASKQGHLMEVGEEGGKKLWMLTETGENFVEEELRDE